jgi:hypothetical protein
MPLKAARQTTSGGHLHQKPKSKRTPPGPEEKPITGALGLLPLSLVVPQFPLHSNGDTFGALKEKPLTATEC